MLMNTGRVGSTNSHCGLGRDIITVDTYYRKERGKFSIAMTKLFASSGISWALALQGLDCLQVTSILLHSLQAGGSSLLFDVLLVKLILCSDGLTYVALAFGQRQV